MHLTRQPKHLFTFALFLSCSLPMPAITVALDFAGVNGFNDAFTNVGNNQVPGEIRWNGISRVPGVAGPAGRIDMVATVASGSNYSFGAIPPRNTNGPSTNPAVPGGATLLKVEVGTDVTFDFNFYNNGSLIALTTALSFLDFDETDRTANNQGIVSETLTFLGVNSTDAGSATFESAPRFNVDTSNPMNPIFSSSEEGNASDNPTDLTNLTTEQSEKALRLNLVEATGFTVNLSVGGSTPDNDARSFFISDAITFNNPQTISFVPEPSSLLLLILSGTGLLSRRRAPTRSGRDE